jgi:hypothetical protein
MAERKDTTEYSSSKAPETRVHAEEKDDTKDMRLFPGGATGSPTAQGMAAMDRETVPNKAKETLKSER